MEQGGTRSESQSSASGTQPKEQPKENVRGAVTTSPGTPITRPRDAFGAAGSESSHSPGSDVQSLRNDLNGLKDSFAKLVSKSGGEAARSAREVTSNVAGQVSGVASDLAGRGSEIASAATDQAKGFASELENMARRNPLGAIAGGVVVGVLIGMMGRRSR